MQTQMDCFGLTDRGQLRPTNQDHFLVADLNKSMRVHGTSLNLDDESHVYGGSQGKLLVVADGMGGEAEGERASTIAVDQLTSFVLNSLSWCFRLEEDSEQDFEDHLKEALKSCQESIQAVAKQHPAMKSMGTTMTMAYVVWPRAFVVHVGDSRCYLLRGGKLEQVTVDHTMATILAESGKMSQEEARHTPMGHALWNAIGGNNEELSVDVNRLSLQPGDVMLLCTDGLYDMLNDEQLTAVLSSKMSAEAACRKLIDLANESGGNDNITVIVSRFETPQLDDERAFVEVEVPLETLTAKRTDLADTVVNVKALP